MYNALYMTTNNENAVKIPREKLGVLLEKYDENLAEFSLSDEWQRALEIILLYEADYSEKMINRPHDREFLKKHFSFIKALGLS